MCDDFSSSHVFDPIGINQLEISETGTIPGTIARFPAWTAAALIS
jgi:hypothetical protein